MAIFNWTLKASAGNFLPGERGKSRKTFAATRDFYHDDEFRRSRPIYLAATSTTLTIIIPPTRKRYKVIYIYLGKSTNESWTYSSQLNVLFSLSFSLSLHFSALRFFLKSIHKISSTANRVADSSIDRWLNLHLLLHYLLVIAVYLYIIIVPNAYLKRNLKI